MSQIDFDSISKLSSANKLARMEHLWSDLSSHSVHLEPPNWHQTVLRERQTEWNDRENLAEDWETAKNNLLDEFNER